MHGELAELAKRIRACTACRLHLSRKTAVPGTGPVPACAAVVGEGPGAEEDRTGVPFVGKAGKLLDELLQQAGIPRSKLWITNAVRCYPHEGGRTRPPRAEEVEACRQHLTSELALVRPGAILALGSTASGVLLEDPRPVRELRGKIHRCAIADAWVVVSYHPAYLLRQQDEATRREFLEDLALFRRAVRAELGTRIWPWKNYALHSLGKEGSPVPLPSRIPPWGEGAAGTVDPDLAGKLLGPACVRPWARVYWDVRNLHPCWMNATAAGYFLRRAAAALLRGTDARWMLCGYLEDGRPCRPLAGPYLGTAAVEEG